MTESIRSILVVDDNLDDAFQVNCHFNEVRQFQHRFQHVSSSRRAKATLRRGNVDIVFIAVHLKSGGRDLLVDLRSDGCDQPMIMVCEAGDGHLIPDLMRSGADDCIFKDQFSPEALQKSANIAIEQRGNQREHTQQRALLTKTLTASVMILVDMLASTKPKAFGRARRTREVVRQLAGVVVEPVGWELEVATMLSPIGCLHLPESLLETLDRNRPLTSRETELFKQHPKTGATIIRAIPRMDKVAEIVAYQEKHFDGLGAPQDACQGKEIPLGARILKIALDYQALRFVGYTVEYALDELDRRVGWYDPELLALLRQQLTSTVHFVTHQVRVADLEPSMILEDHIITHYGAVVVPEGTTISESQKLQLIELSASNQLREPFRVRIPRRHTPEARESLESMRHLTGYLLSSER